MTRELQLFMQIANKILINTILQYGRLVINLLISLYSVRLILKALGPDDYGIYDVVAGVVALMGFIEASLSQTSIRFISVSIGSRNIYAIRKSINASFWLHLFIALITIAILLFIGYFLFSGFLNISEQRIIAAQVVFYSMCVSVFFQIVCTPLVALITSHENFVLLTVITIFNSLSKLAVAFYISFADSDRLILYGILMAFITVLNTIMYFIYSLKNYSQELHLSRISYEQIKEQVCFAGWTLFDVLGSILNRQGYAIMINKFFGTRINAIFAISRQMEGQMYGVSAAVIDTLKPQIIKSYGQGNISRMFRLSMTAGKLGFSLMSFICIPLMVMMPQILSIWLGTFPHETVSFARLMILSCMSEQLTRGLVYANQATGNIKWFSIIVSSIRTLALPVSIVFCYLGCKPIITICIFLLFETMGSISRIFVISKLNELHPVFLGKIFLRALLPFLVVTLVCWAFNSYYNSYAYMLINIGVTWLVNIFLLYMFSLTNDERCIITGYINSLKKKIC